MPPPTEPIEQSPAAERAHAGEARDTAEQSAALGQPPAEAPVQPPAPVQPLAEAPVQPPAPVQPLAEAPVQPPAPVQPLAEAPVQPPAPVQPLAEAPGPAAAGPARPSRGRLSGRRPSRTARHGRPPTRASRRRARSPRTRAAQANLDRERGERPVWEVRGALEETAQESLAVGAPAGRTTRVRHRRAPRSSGLAQRRGRRGRPTRARVAALLALLLAAALVWFLVSLFQPFAGSGSGSVIVRLPKGSSASKIGSILARDGVVPSGFFFDVRALLEGKRGSLHSGRFQLRRDMSYSGAIDALSKPPPRAIAVKVVIPEGYTRLQIAEVVSKDSLSGDYLAATKRSSLLSPAHSERRRARPTSKASCSGDLRSRRVRP